MECKCNELTDTDKPCIFSGYGDGYVRYWRSDWTSGFGQTLTVIVVCRIDPGGQLLPLTCIRSASIQTGKNLGYNWDRRCPDVD